MHSDVRYTRRAALTIAAAATAGLLAACTSDQGDTGTDVVDKAARLTLSKTQGGVSGGTTVTVRGSNLDDVRHATVDDVAATITARTSSSVTLTTPPADDFVPATVKLALLRDDGGVVASTSFTYALLTGLDRQLNYLLKYWKHYNPAYTAIPDDDCVDFTSQSLLQRGWKQQGDWTHDPDNVYDSGAAWRSSTAFRDFMVEHPSLGTALTDDQRDKVKLGDVVQFDWDDTGDRDHTGVVTRITKDGETTRIYFAGHTNDSDYRSVDTAITKDHPGGTAYYWSLT